MMNLLKFFFVSLFFVSMIPNVMAQIVDINQVPSNWEVNGNIGTNDLYITIPHPLGGSVCTLGYIHVSALSFTVDEINRLYSSILTAKIAKVRFFLSFDNVGCNLIGFRLPTDERIEQIPPQP